VDRLKRIKAIRLALAVNTRYGEDGGGYLAASLTYYGFLSLFPLLLLAMAAVGFILVGDPGAQQRWAERLAESIPGFGSAIGDNIRSLVDQRRGAGVIGIAGLLWSSTGLTNAAGYSLSRIFRQSEVQGFVQKRLWSIAVTLGLGLVALTGAALSGVVGGITATGAARSGLAALTLAISVVVDVTLFLASYRVLTTKGVALRRLWPGALLAGVGWTVLKVGGTFYASRTVAHASEVYGTFGSVVGVLALLYFAARLFIYGAELNAVLIDDVSTSRA
jgi:YihY family inner membrane protein